MKSLLKKISIFTLSVFALCAFSSCKAKKIDTTGKLKVISTIFPEYDWFKNVAGEENPKIIHSLLIKSGIDLHSYQPSTKDMIDISDCDLLIYVGGESDEWIKKATANSTNPNQKVLNLMEILKDQVKEEELVEGMQAEEEEDDEDEHHEEGEEHHHEEGEEHHHHHDGEIEYDEHVWLSVKNAVIIVEAIKDTLCQMDSENALTYQKNAEEYIAKLNALDAEYQAAFKNSNGKPLIFCDRFPFRYLTEDYKLPYYAAFLGCSTESEASFETVIFLANKLNELDINNVIIIENSADKIANTVIATAKRPSCNIFSLDSMQSTTLNDIFKGKTYIDTMKSNLEELKKIIQ